MKIGNSWVVTSLMIGLFAVSNIAKADAIPPGKAAELAAHRIERLVILKKVDEGFQTKFHSLDVVVLPKAAPTDPLYKVTVSQYGATDGTKSQLELLMDETGKTLSNNVVSTSTAEGSPTWPDKDPMSLIEGGVHFVIGATAPPPAEVDAFNRSLSQLSLSLGANPAGEARALVDIKSTQTTQTLRLFVKLDGTFDTYAILP